ncbi:MAG: DUF1284 domain-containing protein [Prevotella sp.]|nr:DUF1284 domain-containing protein [Prevotella sp.]
MREQKSSRFENGAALRPHHLLCTEFFRGYGYSGDFTENMAKVISELNADDPTVRLVTETDIICRSCPNNNGGVCTDAEKVLRYDSITLSFLGACGNGTARWSELKKSAREKIISTGNLGKVCADCQWFDICGNKRRR